MRPIHFKEVNTEFAKDQKEYQPLPAHVKDSPLGEVICCWKLTIRERVRLLFSGRMYLELMMFRDDQRRLNPLTPHRMTTNKSDLGI